MLYHPPLSPPSIRHVALSSRTFRVFGLDDPAWRDAGESRRRARRRAVDGDGEGDGEDEDGGDEEEDEDDEAELIWGAVRTALSEDAGGLGTAGFHTSKVTSLRRTGPGCYDGDLVPRDGESIVRGDGDGERRLAGNDGWYVRGDGGDGADLEADGDVGGGGGRPARPFRVRITVSRASVGASAREYSDRLLLRRHACGDQPPEDPERWVEEDDDLRPLRDGARSAQEAEAGGGGGGGGPLGYHVEMLLLEPHAAPGEAAVGPPRDIDKGVPSSRPGDARPRAGRGEEVDSCNSAPSPWTGSALALDAYGSGQFRTRPGQWEAANLRAFDDVGLDLRKALVRIEFPVFPEGCGDRTFREVYQLNARLKSGSYATVCRGTHRATGRKVAIKCVLRKDLPPPDDAAIYDEVLILSTLRHRYVCPLIDFFEEAECYFLVMPLMTGGDLFDRIGKRKVYTEEDARSLSRKMLESVRYCHENSVAHCDMKPKNLLLVTDEDDVSIVLADFGFATRVYEPRSLTKQCGTPFFVSPEVLMRSPYDQQSDLWSVGVIVFLLLSGDLPFSGRSQKELFRAIVMGRYDFEEESWRHVSEPARDLVRRLLVTDPSSRITAREALASPWMRQRGNLLAGNNLMNTSQKLKGFNARMKLRSSMIAVSTAVSWKRMTGQSSSSGRKMSSEGAAKDQPSFLNLPNEEIDEGEDAS